MASPLVRDSIVDKHPELVERVPPEEVVPSLLATLEAQLHKLKEDPSSVDRKNDMIDVLSILAKCKNQLSFEHLDRLRIERNRTLGSFSIYRYVKGVDVEEAA